MKMFLKETGNLNRRPLKPAGLPPVKPLSFDAAGKKYKAVIFKKGNYLG